MDSLALVLVKYFCECSLYRGCNLLTSALRPGLSTNKVAYPLQYSTQLRDQVPSLANSLGCTAFPFRWQQWVYAELPQALSLRHVRLTLYRLFGWAGRRGWWCSFFAYHGFRTHSAHGTVLLTSDWHTFLVNHETKVHPHRNPDILLDLGNKQFRHLSLNNKF